MTGRATVLAIPLLATALVPSACSSPSDGTQRATGSAEAAAPTEATSAAPRSAAGPRRDPLVGFVAECVGAARPSLECEWRRSLLVAETVQAFWRLERARDRRAVPGALAALDLFGEPEILVAAGRVLGPFAEEPGVAERAIPLLDSPWLEVQRIGAQLLSRQADAAFASIGRQWLENHGGATVATPYDRLDFPAHYGGMGFPDVPGGERYTPADSDRSIGWWSPDPAAQVAARLAETTGVATMSYVEWGDRVQQHLRASVTAIYDPARVAELQRLSEQYMKSSDPALLERIQKMQEEFAAPADQLGQDLGKGVDQVATPPGSARSDQVWFLAVEPKPGRDSRAILVYRQPGLERTVIQMAWDLRDYPPAWGGEDAPR